MTAIVRLTGEKQNLFSKRKNDITDSFQRFPQEVKYTYHGCKKSETKKHKLNNYTSLAVYWG
jgi:hypothetical protein